MLTRFDGIVSGIQTEDAVLRSKNDISRYRAHKKSVYLIRVMHFCAFSKTINFAINFYANGDYDFADSRVRTGIYFNILSVFVSTSFGRTFFFGAPLQLQFKFYF